MHGRLFLVDFFAMVTTIVLTGVALFFVVQSLVVCWLLARCLKRVPGAYRKLAPELVWLLMVPGLHWVWNFVVFLKVSASYSSYFKAAGDTSVGDCGRMLSMLYCLSSVICPVLWVLLMSLEAEWTAVFACWMETVPLGLLIASVSTAVSLKNRIPELGRVAIVIPKNPPPPD